LAEYYKIRRVYMKLGSILVRLRTIRCHINLTPNPKEDPDGNKLPALSNLGMGYVFEELIRKFNEENNEEAGEHFTPRRLSS
jgi:type I restriction enzyme M protein